MSKQLIRFFFKFIYVCSIHIIPTSFTTRKLTLGYTSVKGIQNRSKIRKKGQVFLVIT